MLNIKFLWILISMFFCGKSLTTKLASIHGNTGVQIIATSNMSEPTLSISVEFTVSFDKKACCPYVLLITSTAAQAFHNKTCVVNQNKILRKMSEHSNAVVELRPPIDRTSTQDPNFLTCVEDNGNHICKGSLNGVTYSPNIWNVLVVFECNKTLPVTFGYNVNFRSGPDIQCEPYKSFFPKCDELNLTKIHFPNIFGASTQGNIQGLLGLISNAVYSPCYEHFGEYFCRANFQPCDSTGDLPGNQKYYGYPYRETCYAVHNHCREEFKEHLEFDFCLWYPSVKDNITCFSPEVTCDEPQAPSHGKVKTTGLTAGSEAVYDCHVFFDIHGDSVRTCHVSGMWSGVEPRCDAFSATAKITFSIIGIIIAMIIVISIVCTRNVKAIKVLLFIKFNLSFGRRLEIHGREHDVFVVYHHDAGFVLQELLPLLERHDITAATEDCFALGRDKFSELQHTITQSRSALIVITAEFLKEKWKLYQLNQAVCTEIAQSNFKVVFLLCQKLTTLGELPENLLLFLRVGATVERYDGGWQRRLVYELKHRTKRSVSQRISFGRQSFDARHAVYEMNVPEQPEGNYQGLIHVD